MPIPNFQYFMLPVLQAASSGVANISEVVKSIAKELNLSEEDKKIREYCKYFGFKYL